MKYLGYFIEGEAQGGGDCLFDSIIRELRIIFPGKIFTIETLREDCKKLAERSDVPEWFKTGATALRDHLDRARPLEDYIEMITITSMSDPTGIRGLPRPIWGSPEVEGRAICQIYGIKLHLVERHIINKGSASEQEVLTHTIIDESGSRQVTQDEIDHHDPRIIHILNKGNLRFAPLSYKLENTEEHAINPYGNLADSTYFLSYDKIKRDKQRNQDIEKVRKSIINPHAEVQDAFAGINKEYDALSISKRQDLYFKNLCDFNGSPTHALLRLREISNLLEKCNYKTVTDLITKGKIDLTKISRQLVSIIHNYSLRRSSKDGRSPGNLCKDRRSPGDLCAGLYMYILQRLLITVRSESLMIIDKVLSSLLPPNPKRPYEPSIIAAISGNLMLGNTEAFLALSQLLSWMEENGVLTKKQIVEALSATETDHHNSKQKMACDPFSFYKRVKAACDYHNNNPESRGLQDKKELIDALKILYRHGLISENSKDEDNRALVDILNKKIKKDNRALAKNSNQIYEADATGNDVTQARIEPHKSQKKRV